MTDRNGSQQVAGTAVPLIVILTMCVVIWTSAREYSNVASNDDSTSSAQEQPNDGVPAELPAGKTVKRASPETEAVLPITSSVVGHSVNGAPIEHLQIGRGSYHILFIASIHGNENRGTPLLNRLADHIEANQVSLINDCSVVLLPMVNPDGVKANLRFNAQGVDLNRNFPAGNRENSRRYGMQALSEPEAVAIHRVILDFQPDHIVTLHEPLNCVDYDGPAAKLAEQMARVCPLNVKKLGSRPGSLGSFAGVTLQIPTITFELPRDARNKTDEHLWQSYGESLIESVRYRHREATAGVFERDAVR